MRDAAMVLEVGDRPEPADDEIEVGRGAGEEARGDASWQRVRRRILPRGRSREQRSRESVGQGIQEELFLILDANIRVPRWRTRPKDCLRNAGRRRDVCHSPLPDTRITILPAL